MAAITDPAVSGNGTPTLQRSEVGVCGRPWTHDRCRLVGRVPSRRCKPERVSRVSRTRPCSCTRPARASRRTTRCCCRRGRPRRNRARAGRPHPRPGPGRRISMLIGDIDVHPSSTAPSAPRPPISAPTSAQRATRICSPATGWRGCRSAASSCGPATGRSWSTPAWGLRCATTASGGSSSVASSCSGCGPSGSPRPTSLSA
jgi:hypothetical protein